MGYLLTLLCEATGVEISTNKTSNMKRITRSYENQTIENIIRDVFRGTSYALVWNYGENHLESIGICFFDSGSSGSRNVSTNKRSTPNKRVVGRSLAQKPPRSRREISQPKKRLPGNLAASKSKSKTTAKEKNGDDDEDDDDDDDDDEDED